MVKAEVTAKTNQVIYKLINAGHVSGDMNGHHTQGLNSREGSKSPPQ